MVGRVFLGSWLWDSCPVELIRHNQNHLYCLNCLVLAYYDMVMATLPDRAKLLHLVAYVSWSADILFINVFEHMN